MELERVTSQQLASLRRVSKTYEPGAVLAAEGESSADLFLLVDGTVRIRRGDKEIEVVKTPGSFFGHLAYFTNSPRSATIEVLTAACIVRIHAENIAAVLSRAPSLSLRLVVDTARLFRERELVREFERERPEALEECVRRYLALLALQTVVPIDSATVRTVLQAFLSDLAEAGLSTEEITLPREFIPDSVRDGKVRESLEDAKMKALQAKRETSKSDPNRALLQRMSFEF